MASGGIHPDVRTEEFERDTCLLAALLLAGSTVAGLMPLRRAAAVHIAGEVRRLLVLTAVSARQMLSVLDGDWGNEFCGRYCPDAEKSRTWRQLRFRRACNAIIHGLQTLPESMADATGEERETESAARSEVAQSLVRIRGRDYGRSTDIRLDGAAYAQCCASLSRAYANAGRHRRTQPDEDPLRR